MLAVDSRFKRYVDQVQVPVEVDLISRLDRKAFFSVQEIERRSV
jgi:hypothetical protein